MQITEVKVFLKEGQDKKLKGYATLTFDNCFVVRNVKVIEGTKGLFIAMPSRKLKDPCQKCGFRNEVRSKFCNQCGAGLPQAEFRAPQPGEEGLKQSEHKDIAHPITAECRDYIQRKVLEAYDNERRRGPSPRPAPARGQERAPQRAPERPPERAPERPPERPPERAPERPPSAESFDEDNDIEL